MGHISANVDTDAFKGIGLSARPESKEKKELGQKDFLRLMVTQIQNQDPFKPMENGDFITQIAQFGTVNGIEGLQKSFTSLSTSLVSSQALQASALVGRSIVIESSVANLTAGEGSTIKGSAVVATSATNVKVDIIDGGGQLVKTINLGQQDKGLAGFTWDGTNEKGKQMAPGQYSLEVKAQVNGKTIALGTVINEKVESVSFGNAQQGLLLNTESKNTYSFSQVKQVK